VEIPQQGDVDALGKTEATTRLERGELPELYVARDCGDGTNSGDEAEYPRSHGFLLED
jgi:hypothetical protein